MTRRTSLVSVRSAAVAVDAASPPVLPAEREPACDVRVSLRRLRTHVSGRSAKYRLSVDNRGHVNVETLTYALSPGVRGESAAPAAVVVPGRAALNVDLVLPLPRAARLARAVTEVRTQSGTYVFGEGPARVRKARAALWWLAAVLAGGLALWLTPYGAPPAVTALAAPADVAASRPFSVAYVLARARQAHYAVVSARGFVATEGTLTGTQGSFDVALPYTTTPEIYEIRIAAHGRFGEAVRTAQIVAEPDAYVVPAAPLAVRRPARIAAPRFAVERLSVPQRSVAGGKGVIVYYRVASTDGMVRLIDQSGTVRAEALLDRRGNSILLAPYVAADQDFRVVLHAERGKAQAEKSVALRVTQERSLDDVLAAARRKNDGPIALVRGRVAPGEPIEVGIVRYEPGLRVALVDPQGQEVASSSVVDDQNEVTLTAPALAGTAKFTVIATFMNGVSEETVVRNVTIGGSPQSDARVDAATANEQRP